MGNMTKNIVPRNTGEGGLGTTFKHWLNGFFDNLFAAKISDGNVEITVSEVRSLLDSKSKPNGLASLDSSGKLVASQIPGSLLGSLHYKGLWDSNTNTPQIPAATSDNTGNFYKVSVPSKNKTTIDSNSEWTMGDFVISNGKSWDRLVDSNNILSVNGKTGVVELDPTDIGLGNVTNNAQVKKSVNSVDNSITLWDGTTGDKLKAGPSIGTSPGNVIQLDADSKLPAVDGSLLVNLPQPVSGVSAGNFIKLDSNAKLPAVDGSQLTNLPQASVNPLDIQVFL